MGAVARLTLFSWRVDLCRGCSCAWPASLLIAFAAGDSPGCSCVRPASLLIAFADGDFPGCSCAWPASLLIAFAGGASRMRSPITLTEPFRLDLESDMQIPPGIMASVPISPEFLLYLLVGMATHSDSLPRSAGRVNQRLSGR